MTDGKMYVKGFKLDRDKLTKLAARYSSFYIDDHTACQSTYVAPDIIVFKLFPRLLSERLG